MALMAVCAWGFGQGIQILNRFAYAVLYKKAGKARASLVIGSERLRTATKPLQSVADPKENTDQIFHAGSGYVSAGIRQFRSTIDSFSQTKVQEKGSGINSGPTNGELVKLNSLNSRNLAFVYNMSDCHLLSVADVKAEYYARWIFRVVARVTGPGSILGPNYKLVLARMEKRLDRELT
jgi:hypothetical protein